MESPTTKAHVKGFFVEASSSFSSLYKVKKVFVDICIIVVSFILKLA